MKVNETELAKVVKEVLHSSQYPIFRQQDDWGLEEYEYYDFVKEVLDKLP